MAIIGIDLGTTNSLVSIWKDGKSTLIPNRFGDLLTPSVVYIEKNGTYTVGRVAKEHLISHPQQTASLFKRDMGTDKKYTLAKHTYLPEELSAMVIKSLKEDAEIFLGEEVTEAVISVPAYFTDSQRYATKQAGTLAGLQVERLINEPSAAALAFWLNQNEEEELFLVIDLGGGTLDVTLVDCFERVINIVAISGNNQLGGSDFDELIARKFCEENSISYDGLSPQIRASLLRKAELAKIALTDQQQTISEINEDHCRGKLELNNKNLVPILAPALRKIKEPIQKILMDAHVKPNELSRVILVGGSCKMPIIQRYLAKLLGKEPVSYSQDTVIALGAGTYAAIKARNIDVGDIILTDICPFTLGTAIFNRGNPQEHLMKPIIERNSTLPCSREVTLCTVSDNQEKVKIDIYQGEGIYAKYNVLLGEMTVDVPPGPAGKESICVRYTYDINGILEAEVRVNSTGERKALLILGRNSGLTRKNAQNRLLELKRLKVHPREDEKNRLAIAWGERLYVEALSDRRDIIQGILADFEQVLEKQNLYLIEKARKNMENWFRQLESGMILESLSLLDFDNDLFADDEELEENCHITYLS